ncbi:translocation/assembly module TamB domain-containing protein [Marinilabilia rubra]|uniref:Translocation and assembly module TamB C-terminal domain-containing protein n=1 Tax=Marinilabilia rubra TaxID=2162893 RepID=A0A2U2BE57_9BACT|nr:translocation/assembly module TamB domain-containing protein [Marinilabilia rubra]PWE01352.1 hypothetical protein DDZ16_02385 [Marinilabilia rubra]
MQKLLKYILYTFSGLIALMLLLLLFTQTGIFREIVRDKAVKMANEQLNGEVSLEELEGNFFTNLTLRKFSVKLPEKDTLFSFDKLALRYSLWPLLSNKVYVEFIELDQPGINLTQYPDSSWNFQALFPSSEKEPAESGSSKSKMVFQMGAFNLNNGQAHIDMADSVIPAFLSDLNIQLSGRYGPGELAVDLQHLGFLTPPRVVDLKHLQFSVNKRDSVWSVKDFALVTPKNQVEVDGNYAGLDSLKADIVTKPVHLEEFSWVIPDFKLGVTPEIKLNSHVSDNNLELEFEAGHKDQKITVKGSVKSFTNILSDSLRYKSSLDLRLLFQKISPEEWLLLPDLPLKVSGNVRISGNGLKDSNQPLTLEGDFSGTRWDTILFKDFGLRGRYLDGDVKVRSNLKTGTGTFNLDASANINKSSAPVDLWVRTQNFSADRFLPEWGDSTKINMELKARGTGRDFESLIADFSLMMSQSLAARVPVDTMFLEGKLVKGEITLDTMLLQNHSVFLHARGRYSKDGEIQSYFHSRFRDLVAFQPYLQLPLGWDSLLVEGQAHGRPDSLLLNVLARADSLNYDTIAMAAGVDLLGKGVLTQQGFEGEGNVRLSKIKASGQYADSLTLKASVKPDTLDARLSVWMPDSLWLETHILSNMKSPLKMHIPVLKIGTPYDEFAIEGEGPHIFIDSTRMEMDELHLRAGNNKSLEVKAGGIYQPGDSIDVRASVSDFDLSLIQKILDRDITFSGMASADLEASGPLQKPVLNLNLRLDSLEARELRIKKLMLDLGHRSDTIKASMVVQSPAGDSISLNGLAPVFISLSDSQMVSTLKTIEGRLVAKDIRPSSFLEYDDPDKQFFRARVNMDIKAGGEIGQPVLKGYIRVNEGKISYPAYGLEYTDLKVVTNLDSNKVVIDSVFARSGDGSLLVKGILKFDTTLVAGDFSDANLSLKASEFFVSHHRNHEVQIDADAWVKINDDKPQYGGNLTVLRASFYLPALLDMGGSSEINKPLLVQAMEETPGDSVVVEEGDTIQIRPKEQIPQTDLVKNMTGKMNVRIPRNTWVKSEDMNLELYGDFDLLKNNEYFEIFGTLGISRGYYTLYGRKLIIREGELSFQGGEEINPRVNLKAAYQFRGKDKQKNELIMIAGGTAFEPNLSFTLNGTNITERDAMAYLIFNQSFDELSFSNQEGVSGNVPSAMLSGLVSSQLTKTVGKTFNLDMVEIKAGEDWESATFMVGKYITNNLFVTYQRGFGENEEESLTPQTITLEYEVTRNLSLRLTQGDVKDSGVDVILKFEKD